MRVDLGRQLQFPREIVETSLRPDLIMWSEPCKTILLVELTVPWEEGMEAANERKRAKYADLVEDCREAGWKATMCPVEVGCRGFSLGPQRFACSATWDVQEQGVEKPLKNCRGGREGQLLAVAKEEA